MFSSNMVLFLPQLLDSFKFEYTAIWLAAAGETMCFTCEMKMNESLQSENLTASDVEQCLARILATPEFQSSAAISQFLEYVVTETLAGRAERLKAYTIAVYAYGRRPDFDPQTDTIVRVHARRLRRALERYYLTEGAVDPVIISLVPGSYVPSFRRREESTSATGSFDQGDARVDGIESPATDRFAFTHRTPAILVLPFAPLGLPNDELYLADGFTEQLGATLSSYQDIRVFGPLNRVRLAAEARTSEELACQYGADFVLCGTLRKRDATLKLSVRLVERSTWETVWSGQYDNHLEPADLLDFEEYVATCVANTLADSYGVVMRRLTQRLLENEIPSHVSFDAVLRWHHYFTVLTTDAWHNARVALENAVAADPNYAATHAMLADMHGAEYHLMGADRSVLSRAESLVARALSLDPDSNLAHFMQASVHMLQGRRDLFVHKAAYVLNVAPHRSGFLGAIGVFLGFWGEWDRGMELVEEAMALNPHYPGWYHYLPFLRAYRAGDFTQALIETTHFTNPEFYWDVLLRTAVLGKLGMKDESKQQALRLQDLLPDTDITLQTLLARTVLTKENVDSLLEGLQLAGLPFQI